MEVGYRINNGESVQYAHAHIKTMDLLTDNYRIHLGGDLDEQDRIHRDHPSYLKDKRILKYPSVRDYLEAFCEGLITHEIIHLTIFDLTKDFETVRDFDTIDELDEICAPDFWGS